ncbi:MCE family protein [Mycobacterium sp.]|jgi:phospholipid/cholesterol/gamma-HCH transport system substrate-binding protein|uniref:MCE family protein n=1 Tax=Mycobacterium sp. TaxID=1785 RepID=UPI002D64AB80|nr:MCE family protein [Mycobacterium sp.]HZA08761.1 MCE family protein [Mycobacterium sp.]
MLDRLARIQLSIFALVTVVTVGAIATFYLHLPARLGIGAYNVTANFVAGGGLYKNANVAYRGVTVGRVESMSLTNDGVDAHMRLNSEVKIPANVTATVKSVSAVGEQYVDLVPPDNPAKAPLHNGDRIGRDRTAIGQDIAGLLRQADDLVSSVNNTRLQDLLRETFKAFNGAGPELARLIQSARPLVDEANASWPETSALIDQVGPFLQAQIRSGDDIRSLSDGLARFTTELRAADPQLRATLTVAPGAIDEANTTFSGIRPSFPVLAANLANLGRVGVIYHRSIEQALVIFPALMGALITLGGGSPTDEGGKLDFKIDFGDPPPCTTGFVPPPFIRPPGDQTLRDLPKDMYCKVPQNDPSAVRGARNYPCQEFPGKRAPTIQLCRDPRGYVPIGNNPWRGPPIPTGTPVVDGRNILPPNKFPYIPPQADPDPGYPVAPGMLPPGIAGPGPAPHQPWPVAPPPNNGPPPPPLTAWIPPAPYPDAWPPPPNPQPPPLTPGPYNPVAPPPGPAPAPAPPPNPADLPPADVGPPQAGGVSYGTYDQHTGVFVDPKGGTGVYAPAAANMRPQENWLDLMLDPRQA